MGRARASSCSSSSSASSFPHPKRDLFTDLSLGLPMNVEGNECTSHEALFVKVYMEGIPIGRKLDLRSVDDGYYGLISTLDYMFNASILWADVEFIHSEKYHVLTYEDKEGDWLIVGDIPWEMFLASVKRLRITRADRF